MTVWQVLWTSTARQQAIEAQGWWAEQRPTAPSLFLDELFAVIALLEAQPWLGLPYAHPRAAGLRRVLLARSRYQVFYRVDERHHRVELIAIWHSGRGSTPSIGE